LNEAHPLLEVFVTDQLLDEIVSEEEDLDGQGDGAEVEVMRGVMFDHRQTDPQAIVRHDNNKGHDFFLGESCSAQSHDKVGPDGEQPLDLLVSIVVQ